MPVFPLPMCATRACCDLWPTGKVLLLTNPVVAGYVQNPISIYYCCDDSDQLVVCIAEVRAHVSHRLGALAAIGCLPHLLQHSNVPLPYDLHQEVTVHCDSSMLLVWDHINSYTSWFMGECDDL